MTAQQEYLRPNLRAGLLTALELNRRHDDGDIRLFELGRVYHAKGKDLPDEPEVLCGILSGPFNFFDAKGVVEGLLGQLGAEAGFEISEDETLLPGKRAAIVLDGNKVGVVGEVHPGVLQAFDISDAVYMFEVGLPALLPFTVGYKMFQPVPRFPAIVRDMALVVDSGVTHQRVVDIVRDFSLVSQVTIFDVYSGDQVPAGKKSMAYRVTFQSPTHTLTDKEVDKVQQQILKRLSGELGATLRS
jgi:phenylalanyl-tRNA synthetase beta chain